MRQLTLTEYQTEPAIPLSREERDLVRRLVPSITLAPSVGTDDRYDVTAGATIGVVQLEQLRIEIHPKVPLERVFFMLAYSLDPRTWRDQLTSFGEAPDLFESLIPGFVHQTRRALRRGVLQGYRTEEEALPTVRGRIRFDEQIRRRYGRLPPIEVRFDEFTEDIELNRTLKAAITRLGRLRIRSPLARRSLREFDHALERVQPVQYDPRRLPVFAYTRLNEHYRPAIDLALLILRSFTLELSQGQKEAKAFLINMNELFERFLATALREELRLSPHSFPQNLRGRRLTLDQRGRIKLKPDLSWWQGPTCVFVGDIKYKGVQVANDDIDHPDLYQLLAYTIASQLKAGLLIYAAEQAAPTEHLVEQAGKRLQLTTLDLRGTPDAILERVRAIATLIRAQAQQSQLAA